MPVTIKEGQLSHPSKKCYSVTQEVYCWQVALQQSLLPLQLPVTKVIILLDNKKTKINHKIDNEIFGLQHRSRKF